MKRKRQGTGGNKRPKQFVRLTPLSQFAGGTRRFPIRTGGFKGYLGRRAAGEKNYLDTALTQDINASTPLLQLLNAPVPGSGANQRIGRKICLKSIQLRLSLRYWVEVTGTAPDVVPGSGVRVLLVWDKQTNGTAVTTTTLFASTDYSLALINMDNRDRFAILMDKVYGTPNTASSLGFPSQTIGNIGGIFMLKKYKKLNHETVFNSGSAGTVSDITTGSLYLIIVTDADATVNSDEGWSIEGNIRIRYEDR